MTEAIKETLEKAKIFLQEVKVEGKRVIWPTRQQLTAATILVIMLLIVIGSYLGIVDVAFSYIFKYIEKIRRG